MPNHCTTTLTIRGEPTTLTTFLERCQADASRHGNRGALTFRTFVPVPPHVLEGETGSALIGRDHHGRWRKVDIITTPEGTREHDPNTPLRDVDHYRYLTTNDGETLPEHIASERGLIDWYFWRNQHWGTKWDAYATEVDDSALHAGELRITFDTAWAPPTPVIHAIQAHITPLGLRAAAHSVEPGMAFQVVHDEHGHTTTLDYSDPALFDDDDTLLEPAA